MLQVILSVLGRIMLCAIFLAAAAGDIMKFEDRTAMVKDKLPIPTEHPEFAQYALIGAIVFSIAGSLLVITCSCSCSWSRPPSTSTPSGTRPTRRRKKCRWSSS